MKELTSRQKKILDFIKSQIIKNGFPPTISEMAKEVRVKSKNAISKMLRRLEALRLIERDGTARGIRLLGPEGGFLRAGELAVPLVGTVPAGSPVLTEENIETWINLPATLIRHRKDVFVLRVKGESMKDAGILDGDLVIVSPRQEIRSRDIIVALLDGEATVKRYIEIEGRRYLKAENPKYKNIYPQSEWSISGKVVGVIRNIE